MTTRIWLQNKAGGEIRRLLFADILEPLPVTDTRAPYPLSWDEQRLLFQALPTHLARMALFKVHANTGSGGMWPALGVENSPSRARRQCLPHPGEVCEEPGRPGGGVERGGEAGDRRSPGQPPGSGLHLPRQRDRDHAQQWMAGGTGEGGEEVSRRTRRAGTEGFQEHPGARSPRHQRCFCIVQGCRTDLSLLLGIEFLASRKRCAAARRSLIFLFMGFKQASMLCLMHAGTHLRHVHKGPLAAECSSRCRRSRFGHPIIFYPQYQLPIAKQAARGDIWATFSRSVTATAFFSTQAVKGCRV